MAIISRNTLIDRCLRALGFPVVTISVSPEQMEDALDQTLELFAEFADVASENIYMPFQISQQNIDDKFIIVPDAITSVNNILASPQANAKFGVALSDGGTSTFSASAINSGQEFSNSGLCASPYNTVDSYIGRLYKKSMYDSLRSNFHDQRFLLTDFNRLSNKIIFHSNLPVKAGEFIIIDATSVLDPETYKKIYSHRWIIKYLTASIKYQHGTNLSAFNGVKMVGGLELDGAGMRVEALEEMEKLETQLKSEYAPIPVSGWV